MTARRRIRDRDGRDHGQIADSGCADIPRHSQSLRSPTNVMCAGEAHPATLLLARVSCARHLGDAPPKGISPVCRVTPYRASKSVNGRFSRGGHPIGSERGKTHSYCDLRPCACRSRGRCRRPVLQAPRLGTAPRKHWHCPGFRRLLPTISIRTGGQTRMKGCPIPPGYAGPGSPERLCRSSSA